MAYISYCFLYVWQLDYFGQQYMGGQLFLLNWKTGQRAALLKEGRPVTYCHFTDDGRLVFRVAGRGDLGEQDACYAVGKDIYGTWRNGCVRLDRLRAVDELEGRHKTGNHNHHHSHADADDDGDHHHLAFSRKRAKEESDEMMVTYCFVEEDIVASPAPTPAAGSGGGGGDQAAGAASANKPPCKPTLFQGEVAKETKWERKLRRIAEEKGKHYETSKTVWGVDFHDDDTLTVTKVPNCVCVCVCDNVAMWLTCVMFRCGVAVGQVAGGVVATAGKEQGLEQEDEHLQPLRQRAPDPVTQGHHRRGRSDRHRGPRPHPLAHRQDLYTLLHSPQRRARCG
jgi:hypothetical protein